MLCLGIGCAGETAIICPESQVSGLSLSFKCPFVGWSGNVGLSVEGGWCRSCGMAMTGKENVRLDKWLWSVRFFKTRSMAATACQAGKIKRVGSTLKPAASIRVGDQLEVPSPCGTHKKAIEVVELIDKRVSAELARKCYDDRTKQETLELANQRRSEQREERKLRQAGDQGRMTKKKRREWNQQKDDGFLEE